MAKNELTTMYGGGFARLIDTNGNVYRMVNVLEATATFDSKQDFLRAIVPNGPSQVIAVATTENTTTLSVKLGEFNDKFLSLASNLQVDALTEYASFPVLNETHIMLTTRTELNFAPTSETTINVYVRDEGVETELTRIAGVAYRTKLAQKVESGETTLLLNDVQGFKVGDNVIIGSEVATVQTVDKIAKTVTLTAALTADHYPQYAATVVSKVGATPAVTTTLVVDAAKDTLILKVADATNFAAGDFIRLGTDSVEYEIDTVDTAATPHTITLDGTSGLKVVRDYFAAHAQEYLTLLSVGGTPGVTEFDVDVDPVSGKTAIILNPKWVGKGISVDYERKIGKAFKIGGDQSAELGYVDFHLVLQNQQGNWLYYRFPSAIPSGKYTLDLKGSFLNLANEFTAVTPPGWAKPYLIIGEM